ncbi:TIP41-like protein [Melia azedarach]|uniref:TIP41-like protein n=1 Tax=Melia azedarach TaxID=155640 RepID=A0ACC1XXL4_MELAZ|nr:TIP41-like protein [Melia azedarach]
MVPRDAHNVTRLWSPDALKEDKKTKEGQTGNRSNRCEKLAMEVEVEEKDLKAAGAERLTGGRRGLRIHGWEIESRKCSILNSSTVQQWEEKLETTHLPEMVFGESCLVLKHVKSGTKIYFNAFDALGGWKQEGLPPVEVPAAAKWKFRSKPFQQVILDYDYTFTTPYCGSETIEMDMEKHECGKSTSLYWEDCEEKIDMVALTSKEPILFYDEVVLYEDELADNGVSLLTVKVRVMPSCWFLLLRFWLRVDGVLMRLRDTRMHCVFSDSANPVILRESCWKEATFQSLAATGYPTDSAAYSDPSIISQRLPVVMCRSQKLKVSGNL